MLSCITVNHGNHAALKNLASSLKQNIDFPWEWIIVDNYHSETEVLWLKNFFRKDPHTHLVFLEKNQGFSVANNEGARFARFDLLAFLNPDIQIKKNTFPALFQALKTEKKIGILTPQLQNPDGSPQENTRSFPTPGSLLGRRIWTQGKKIFIPPKENISVDWAQGSFLLMRRDFFQSLSGFDERYFLFLEDTDLGRKTKAKGKKTYLVPGATAIHSEKRLSGGFPPLLFFKKTFWIHLFSAIKYFWKWRKK
jgi:N-acetylglucosaminyl-diphospho-decaprenol L-rhamnosyltransferase